MAQITLNTYLDILRQRGDLAYEYNPFYNYLTKENLYKHQVEGLGTVYIPEGKAIDKRNGEILELVEKKDDKDGSNNTLYTWKNSKGIILKDKKIIPYEGEEEIIIFNENVIKWNDGKSNPDIVKDSLIDLDTTQLKFDLNHPVDIEIQPSYDGSVNLIINDDKNIPRLINSRFSVREKNTYEIVDRIGENDTNIYSSDTFNKDTSLYFLYKTNPKIEYKGFVSGILPVGQYCFYFTYCDADNNESDIIAESGLIPVFIGMDEDPYSMDGGIKNLTSNKGIKLKLTNLDSSYNYLKVYYVRYFADYQLNRVYEAKKLYHKYSLNSNKLIVQITGNEEAEDIDPNVLNLSKFNPQSILTQAQCKNMLFFGNIVKQTDNYKELQDCALRIVPECEEISDISFSEDYSSGENNYYNSYNIYNKVGYFNDEYYRFGIVFIYLNGTLSNVYNTLGYDMNSNISYNDLDLYNEQNGILIRQYIKTDNEGWIINNGEYNPLVKLNSKGVCKFKSKLNKSYSVKFKITEKIITQLKELNIRGFFIVRLKRIPNLLGLCLILPMDKLLEAPALITKSNNEEKFYTECFVTKESISTDIMNPFYWGKKNGREVDNNYEDRLYEYVSNKNIKDHTAYAGICPDFLLNQPYYNQIFNGSRFKLKKVTKNSTITRNGRYYLWENLLENSENENENIIISSKISSVTEDVPTIALGNNIYKLEMGKTEEVYYFKYALHNKGEYDAGDEDRNAVNEATNIVRGKYSPYLAIQGNSLLELGEIYNIYLDNFIDNELLFLDRMNSSEPFYAISDRYNWEESETSLNFKIVEENENEYELTCYRGDCYYNTFTYRLNRNFNDPSLPNNDKIIDKNTWKDNYDAFDSSKWADISRSDINAVLIGSWITFNILSPYNYALRSEDRSYVSEAELMGSPRSFYPRKQCMWLGTYKMPDSYLYNDAYRATLGYKCYFTLEDINYLKNTFSNRIQYSSIAVLDSFKNNYRESYSTYFRDYSMEYGSIQKLIGFEGYLLVVFEHGIGIAIVNERVLAGGGDGEPVFINTKNVLPEELTIITDTYGTQWPESVIKSEAGYVYGVDTVAKKIWRVKGQQIEILSDFKVNKFLVENILLGEKLLNPIIGLRNIKTHYNNNKKDIMFTFYNAIDLDEEKVWNLCYNELLELFITFYSWVPSYSENIDTQFFTFDRDTSKALSLINYSNYFIDSNSGVLLESPVLKVEYNNNVVSSISSTNIYYRDKVESKLIIDNLDGIVTETNSSNKSLKNYKFELVPNHWRLDECFKITDPYKTLHVKNGKINKILEYFNEHKVGYLTIRPYTIVNNVEKTYYPAETVAITLDTIINNLGLTPEDKKHQNMTTDFYLHGRAGIFDVTENVYPTYWYGKYHPFEFEFVVNDKISQQKIFTNLVIISNKAEPESFHFEIEGDNYEFSSDKRNMYFRLESTKELYLNKGSNILYNRKYTDVRTDHYTYELFYRGNPLRRDDDNLPSGNTNYEDKYKKLDKVYPEESQGLVLQVKSNIFPLYYLRIDTFDNIYHDYREMNNDGSYDFKNLSGSEIIWDRDLNLFDVVTHIKNSPVDKFGISRGNSRYKEGKWNILIPSIIFNLKNEDKWTNNIPPIVINSVNIPDLSNETVTLDDIPNITGVNRSGNITDYIDTGEWTARKEARIRDKWMKVRVRYSGKNLAVIHSLITLYNISYS